MTKKNPLNKRFWPLKNPLIVALDVDSDKKAISLVEELGDLAGGFKLGPRLIHRYGSSLTERVAKVAPLFVDCKFFDIPSTLESSILASFEAGATLVTVHALVGQEALLLLADLERKLNEQRPFCILCVTILTSWDESSLPGNFQPWSVRDHVIHLAKMVKGTGLRGIVCSPQEITVLMDELGGNKEETPFLVTPGIRFSRDSFSDQKRTETPFKAMNDGASALVVGRPIVESSDPRQSAMEISLQMLDASIQGPWLR